MTQIPREIEEEKLRQEIIVRVQQYARRFHRLELDNYRPEAVVVASRKRENRKVEDWFLALLHQVEKEARISEEADYSKVNRFEVIDHIEPAQGRICTVWEDEPIKIEFSLQDDGRTLKILLARKEDTQHG